MPTTRTRRRRGFKPAVSDMQWALLCDRPIVKEPGDLDWDFERWCFQWSEDSDPPWGKKSGRQLWAEHGDAVLAEWIAEHPGTRPSCWWRWSAPRQPVGTYPGVFFDGKLPLPRQRIGGVGTPKFEVLANVPEFWCGVPVSWVTLQEVNYYSGCAVDIHGRPIGQEFIGHHFRGIAIDPKNPPVFEAEASFLERHGLLLPGERRRLREADFRPESILDILDLEPRE